MAIGQRKGFKHSEETKRRISEKMKANPPRFAFKKGCKPPAHAFVKGQKAWNKGLKMPEMGAARTGDKHHLWKGGEKIEGGYVWLWRPDHPNARRGYIKRANLVMESKIGRYLSSEEVVHHKNRNRKDDSEDNLQLCADRAEHMAIHRAESPIRNRAASPLHTHTRVQK